MRSFILILLIGIFSPLAVSAQSCTPPDDLEITLDPPIPSSGSYEAGQDVQICAIVNTWSNNAAGTDEWLHAATFDLGPGWDIATLVANPPPSCDGNGSWGWYDSWTSCATGVSFGPGFAYDSNAGIDCGGSFNDGNPGNNYGDGDSPGCATITSPVEFCLTITTSDCSVATDGEDLSINVQIWSDGESGSWTLTGCNSGQSADVPDITVSTLNCCNDDEPIVTAFDTSCPGVADGFLEIQGNGGLDPTEVFDITVFNDANEVVYECLGCAGTVMTDRNLPAGSYTVSAVNATGGCERISPPFDINEPLPTQADITNLTPDACLNTTVQLQGSIDSPGAVNEYNWTGPGGETYNGETIDVMDPDTYELTVLVDGCPSDPATIEVTFIEFDLEVTGETTVCESQPVNLEATGASEWQWTDTGTGEVIGTDQILTASFTSATTLSVTARDANGCLDEEMVDITVNPAPVIQVDVTGNLCSNETIEVVASGADTYVWQDDFSTDNPRLLIDPAPGDYTLEVEGTDASGCIGTGVISFTINEPSDISLIADNTEVCEGEEVTITAVANTGDIGSLEWSNIDAPDNENPVTITITEDTEVIANVTSTDGCVSDPVSIEITLSDFDLEVTGETTVCENQPLNLEATGASEWQWTDTNTGDILSTDQVLNASFTSSTTLSVTARDINGCLDEEIVNVTVNPTPIIQLEIIGNLCSNETIQILASGAVNYVWQDDFSTDNPRFLVDPVPGDYTLEVEGTDAFGCTGTAVIDFTINEPSDVSLIPDNTEVCEGEEVTITAVANSGDIDGIEWITIAAPDNENPVTITITEDTEVVANVVNSDGCLTPDLTTNITLIPPPDGPVIECGISTPNSVTFNWTAVPDATSYEIQIDGGAPFEVFDLTYTVDGLETNTTVTISVLPLSDDFCPAEPVTFECVSLLCVENFDIFIDPVDPICASPSTAPFDLAFTADSGPGVFTWDGPGIIDADAGTFDPNEADFGENLITLTYTDEDCVFTGTQIIVVNATPVAAFELSNTGPICTDEVVTVTFTGVVGFGAIYEWDFDGAIILDGFEEGPYELTWIDVSNPIISLTVIENDCVSNTATQTVTIESPIDIPVVQCGESTPTSVTFNWNAVNGADSYTIEVVNGPTETQTGTSFTVDNLSPEQAITITVTANAVSNCGPFTSEPQTCSAQSCPNFIITPTPIDPICLTTNSMPVDLMATVSNGGGSGTFSWSGPGVTGSSFDPQVAGVNTHTLTVTYTEGNCSNSTTLDVIVNATPTADFSVTSTTVCTDTDAGITYAGNATAGATYTWNFDGGQATPGTGIGPHTVSWLTAGSRTISLTVTESGCVSEVFTQTIEVDAPLAEAVINCVPTTSSITFNWNEVSGATDYEVNIINGPAGATGVLDAVVRTFTVTGLQSGETVEIEVIAIGDNSCGNSRNTFSCTAQDCPLVSISIDSIAPICFADNLADIDLAITRTGGVGGGTETWSGAGIVDATTGIFSPIVAGVGSTVVSVIYEEGNCSYTASRTIIIHAIPTATFTATSPICQTDNSEVVYTGSAANAATYTWNFDGGAATPGTGVGPHTVNWDSPGSRTISLTVTENECVSEVFTQTVEVDAPLAEAVINCVPTTSSITFSWDEVSGATDYEVNIINGPAGATGVLDAAARTFTVTGLQSGETVEIEVIAIGDGSCGNSRNTISCTAQDCPLVSISIDSIAPICFADNLADIDLAITRTGGVGGGTETWSGAGIVDATMGVFSPVVAGVGSTVVSVTYEEGNCSYTASRTIVINAIPKATFTATSPICQTDNSEIVYTGSAANAATYTWNFDGGQATPGTGVGPHAVTWDSPGNRTISLTVTENECVSEVFTQTVEVDAPLAEAVINCVPTTSSITFNWNEVSGATDYEVNIINGPAGATGVLDAAARTFTVTGLQSGETVEIEVIAIGDNSCGNSRNTFSCTAQDCPLVSISIDSIAPLCFADNLADIDLAITRTGGVGGGSETWSGAGIVDATTGVFSPVVAGVGSAVVSVTYEEGNCSYTASRTIVINAIPMATFTATSPICQTDNSEVIYTGSAANAATYTWNFDGGTATPGTGVGPHAVTWDSPGNRTISLTVTENECVSEVFTQTVEVDAPLAEAVINCVPTTSSITFNWNEVSGATDYEVNIINGPAGATGVLDAVVRTFTVTGLQSGETVEIEVIAIGDNSCGNSRNTFSCTAQDCPLVSISIDSIAPLCFANNLADIDLAITRTGGVGGGSETWSGAGIVDATTGVFSPVVAGVGSTVVSATYEEGNCSYTASRTIVINAIPTATFTATSPICQTDNSEVIYTGSAANAATYTWNFDGGAATPGTGVGPHTVNWDSPGSRTISLTVTENECVSEVFTQTVEVDAPLAEAVINCVPTTSSITFSWDEVSGATDYEVNIINGPAGATGVLDAAARTFTITGLQAGETVEIEVIAIGDGSCGNSRNTFSCTAQDCPLVSISIDSIAPICFADNLADIDLEITRTGGVGGGTETWSGVGIVDATTGIFSPVVAGVGSAVVSVTYEEGNCSYTASRTIVINAIPKATFTATSPICQTDNSEVVYTGSAANAATYTWNFDGGAATPSTGVGPHTVTWDSPGSRTISLTVTENECVSEVFTQTVEVDAPLAEAVINCVPTTSSITFSWDEVSGATDYEVNIINGPAGATGVLDAAARTFTITGLQAGETVEIEVIAIGDGSCGNSRNTFSCTAQDCPLVSISIDSIAPICFADNLADIDLAITRTGGVGGGTETWSGVGIVDATTGIFSPVVAGVGSAVVSVTYEEGNCSYSASRTIVINAIPTATFTATSPICQTHNSEIVYTGSAANAATYTWNFDGGQATPGTGVGPHMVTWDSPGSRAISLTVTENECVSEVFTQTVEVEPELVTPVVTCDYRPDTLFFNWIVDPNGDGYSVTVLESPNENANLTTLADLAFVQGVNPGESYTLEITNNSNNSCPPVSTVTTCLAEECPPVSLSITAVDPICLDATAIALEAIVTDGSPNAIITWSGPGIIDAASGTFDPQQSGIGTHTITAIYIDGPCSTSTSLEIVVTTPNIAGADYLIDPLCVGIDTILNLLNPGTIPSGNIAWTETSVEPGIGNAFDDQTGTFNVVNQLAGTYTFELLASGGSCPEARAITTVTLVPSPIVDAGIDQELACNMGLVSIGDNGSNQSGLSYNWTVDNTNAIITDPTSPLIDVSSPGTYTLTAVNSEGCFSSDEVVVSSAVDVPVASVSISEISCFQAADGAILIDEVNGGQAPYAFSLNGSAPTSNPFFGNLSGDSYTLLITDANGCFTELAFTLIEPIEVNVQLTSSLTGRPIVEVGDTITLTANYDQRIPIDTIIWQPDSVGVREGNSLIIAPQETTVYTITIRDINGCSDTDQLNVIVRQDRQIFLPTAFSPDGNDVNDYFYPQAGDDVAEIRSFLVFNRWGESVFENYNFVPNDITEGWNGRFRGQALNPAVFVYSIEVEYTNGDVILFKGDVVLMR